MHTKQSKTEEVTHSLLKQFVYGRGDGDVSCQADANKKGDTSNDWDLCATCINNLIKEDKHISNLYLINT